MNLLLVTGPQNEPVTRDEVKVHCVIDFDDDDSYLDALILVAREIAERETGVAIISQQWLLSLKCFSREIQLPKPPLLQIDSVEYYDTDGIKQTLDPNMYRTTKRNLHWFIVPAQNQEWPQTLSDHDSVLITFTAGYGEDETEIPATIKQAIYMLIAHYYENREIVAPVDLKEIPRTASALLNLHSVDLV